MIHKTLSPEPTGEGDLLTGHLPFLLERDLFGVLTCKFFRIILVGNVTSITYWIVEYLLNSTICLTSESQGPQGGGGAGSVTHTLQGCFPENSFLASLLIKSSGLSGCRYSKCQLKKYRTWDKSLRKVEDSLETRELALHQYLQIQLH